MQRESTDFKIIYHSSPSCVSLSCPKLFHIRKRMEIIYFCLSCSKLNSFKVLFKASVYILKIDFTLRVFLLLTLYFLATGMTWDLSVIIKGIGILIDGLVNILVLATEKYLPAKNAFKK